MFKTNADFIDYHNANTQQFSMSENQFMDLTFEQFSQIYLGAQPQKPVNE